MGPQSVTHVLVQLCKGKWSQAEFGVSWPCIDVLIHVQLMMKVWHQIRAGMDKQTG